MKKYVKFGNKQFMLTLSEIMKKLNIWGHVADVTDEFPTSWEHVYKVPTKNKAVDIIIYSSVDIRTQYVREKGDDAVRVVMRWKTKNGYMFKKLHKHLRINTLFTNLEKTIKEASEQTFALNFKDFSKMEDCKQPQTPQTPQVTHKEEPNEENAFNAWIDQQANNNAETFYRW